MKSSSPRIPALFVATIVCIVLITVIALFWIFFPTPPTYPTSVLFWISFVMAVLVTAIVYLFFKISEVRTSYKGTGVREDTLMYSLELFSELYRGSPVPYIVIDQNGLIESINFATARLFQVEIEALNSLNVFSLIDGEDATKIALIPEYFKGGRFVNDVEVQIKRPDGAKRWVMLSLFSFADVKGGRKGLLTLVDITKQKMIDKAKTEFVSLASHQLRTPISGLKWNVELLETAGKGTFSDAQSAYVKKISHGVERMDMLVNDFLSVSKFELGTLTPSYVPLDIAQFLTTVHEELAPMAEQKAVRIETEWPTDMGMLTVDSHLLHMISSNLLSNAIKYTPSEGVVRIHAELDTEHFTLTVADTGMGIPLEEQDRLFSKMFRASNAKANVTDGNGLGLYIVKGAAETMGGTIVFESQEGVGTVFTVTLPTRH